MKYLAIDFGENRIGIALSDDKGIVAEPFSIIQRKSDKEAIVSINKICIEKKIGEIVVGIPLSSSEEGQKRYKSFAQKLSETTQLPIKFWDETFSTQQAQNVVGFSDAVSGKKKTRTHRDDVAAAIILQEFLDYEKSR